MTGRGAVLAVLSSLALSASAHAQWWATPKIYCPIGSTACMGAYFTFAPNTGALGGTLFSAYLQNLQGSFTAHPAVAPINTMRLHRANLPPGIADYGTVFRSDPASATPVGNVEVGDFAIGGGPYVIFKNSSGGGPFPNNPTEDAADYYWETQGFLGCTGLYQESPGKPQKSYVFRTCPRNGLDGWVRFDFVVDTWNHAKFQFRNVPLTFNDFAYTANFHTFHPGETSCTFGNPGGGMPERGTNCNVFEYQLPSVTPEPSTLLLVGGALPLALGFIRRRPKRR